MRTVQFVKSIYEKFPLVMILNIMLLGIVGIIEAASIMTLAPVVDFFIHPDLKGVSSLTLQIADWMKACGIPVNLTSLLVFFLSFNVLKSVTYIFARYMILRLKYMVVRDILLGTFDQFFEARWFFFSSGNQGVLLNTFIREINVVGDAFGAMSIFFANLTKVFFYLLVPLYISWQVTTLCVVAAVVFALPFTLLDKKSYEFGQANTTTANGMGSVLHESLAAAKVILGYGNQDKASGKLAHVFEAHRKATIRSQTLNLAIPEMYYPLGMLVLVVALVASKEFGVSLSELAAILYSLIQVLPQFGSLTGQKNALQNFFPSYEQVMNLRSLALELKQTSGERPYQGFQREIAIDHVSYAYPDHEPTLKDVTISIPKGKMVALVGKSGAGKSTFIDVVMGFAEPQQGQVLFDGVPLTDYDVVSYRKRIGYVPQDAILFNMSLKDNLLWANEKATENDIQKACRDANVLEFIETFPEGYQTIVGDRGVRLSGGQMQRVALARAILRKPDILILDEATSALDTRSERLIQEAIEKIAGEITVVVIAHRLSTIVNADIIYVLDEGRVVESGSYSELMDRQGYFEKMTRLQLLEPTKTAE